MKDEQFTPENEFEKHVHEKSEQPTEDDHAKDAEGRRCRDISHNFTSWQDEFVADESVAVPRYLITFKKETKINSFF